LFISDLFIESRSGIAVMERVKKPKKNKREGLREVATSQKSLSWEKKRCKSKQV